MKHRSCLAIVLAAGEGTRMRSAMPKVLHAVAGQSLLAHVLAAIADAKANATAVVVGPRQDAVAAEVRRVAPKAECFVQRERRGTAHAVLAARPALKRRPTTFLFVYGDTPLIRAATLKRLRAPLAKGAAVAVLGFRPADPAGYGRLIVNKRKARRHPRGSRRERKRESDRAVQRRHHGACRRAGACHPRADRQPQPQARILSDRRGRESRPA